MQVTMLFFYPQKKKSFLSELLATSEQTTTKKTKRTKNSVCVFSSACYAISDDLLFHFTTLNDELPHDSSCQDPQYHHL